MLRNLFLASLLCWTPIFAADDVVAKAMRDELARSMKKLQLENLLKPYFIAYREVEMDTCSVTASFGAVVTNYCNPPADKRPNSRQMTVEVRVGDYTRDNTNFYAFRMQAAGVVRLTNGLSVPVDDNYDEIRRELWLATDSAYKQALDVYAKKKGALENRSRTDDAPDFSKEAVVKDAELSPVMQWKSAEITAAVKALSLLFRQSPGIADSEVRFNGQNLLIRYLNSEGSEFSRQSTLASYQVSANAQALDGMPVTDFEIAHGRTIAELPSLEEMTKRIGAMQVRLENTRSAAVGVRYTGPVLFEGQAAAEFVAQGLGNGVVGMPRLVVDDARFENVFASNNGSFSDKVGGKVLPEFLSLTDDPTARQLSGQPLLGGYQVDDDNVKARPIKLIERGILKAMLNSRALIPGATVSTGSRRGASAVPSNLIVSSEKGMPADQLKAELIRLVKARNKEYGILVRRIGNPMLSFALNRGRTIVMTSAGAGAVDIEPLLEAYKVFPDGRQELVRNLRVSGMTLGTYKDIVASSDSQYIYTAPFRLKRVSPAMLGGPQMNSGPLLVSVATPSLLIEDMSLQPPSGEIPNLPFTKHPFFDK